MHRQVKKHLLIYLTCAILITILVQSACNTGKEKVDLNFISREDFIDALDGQWYVNSFCRMNLHNGSESICITLLEDSVEWINSSADTIIMCSLNNPILCSLSYIENMQNWVIAEHSNELILKTEDLCGGSKEYKIDFSHYRYVFNEYMGGAFADTIIYADIKLVSPDDTTPIGYFKFYNELNMEPYLIFGFQESNFMYTSGLMRP